jgi:hypothetical protein
MNTFLSGPMARYLRDQGRFGDTELAHVNPEEEALLRSLGGSGTINPGTGLREYYSDDMGTVATTDYSGTGDDNGGDDNGGDGDDGMGGDEGGFTYSAEEGIGYSTTDKRSEDAYNATVYAQKHGTLEGSGYENDPFLKDTTRSLRVNDSDGGSGSGSGSGTTTTSTTPATPDYTTSEGFKSLLFDLFKSKVLDKPYESYDEDRFAGFNVDQTQAFTDTRAFANSTNQAINDAITAASGETGYASGYAPGELTSGYIPGVSTSRYNPNAYTSKFNARDYTSGFKTAGTDSEAWQQEIDARMNPFTSNVINRLQGDMDRARLQALGKTKDQARSARAFGGSRQGVVEALTSGEYADAFSRTAGGLRQDQFNRAMAGADTDRTTAEQFRQDAFGLTTQERSLAEQYRRMGYDSTQAAMKAKEELRSQAWSDTEQAKQSKEEFLQSAWAETEAAKQAREKFRQGASGIRSGAGRDLLAGGQAQDAATAARINALYGIGAREQALDQANKDFQYQQFLEGRDWDKMNILAGGGLLGSAPGDPEKQTYFTREGGLFQPIWDILAGDQKVINF